MVAPSSGSIEPEPESVLFMLVGGGPVPPEDEEGCRDMSGLDLIGTCCGLKVYKHRVVGEGSD